MKKLLLILFLCFIIPSCDPFFYTPEEITPRSENTDDSTDINIIIDTTKNIVYDTIYLDIII